MDAKVKILVADDDADLLGLLCFALGRGGFEVRRAQDGAAAVAAFESEWPDVVLLDMHMPPRGGLDVCRDIRARSKVPIMMLAAVNREEDLVAAIDCGADDFLSKPFSPRTLLARVRALARRSRPPRADGITVGATHLDLDRRVLQLGRAAPVRLTAIETRFIRLLLVHPGRTVGIERLLEEVWRQSTTQERR